MSIAPPFDRRPRPRGEESDYSGHDGSLGRVLSQEEIAALLDFFLLLDEWDRRRKII